MRTTSQLALAAALALLVEVPAADAAKSRGKVRIVSGEVVAAPYAAARKVAVPVRVTPRRAKRAKLDAAAGTLMLKKAKRVAVPGRKRVAPTTLRAGDRFRARVKVTRAIRMASHWRIGVRRFNVTKRSSTLGPMEVLALVEGLARDLAALETAMTNLAAYVQAGFGKQGGDIAALKSDLASVTATLAGLQNQVAGLETGVPALQSELQQQIGALGGDLAGLETQIGALGGSLAGLEDQIDTVNTALGALCGEPLITIC